jgi:hypothetical protein
VPAPVVVIRAGARTVPAAPEQEGLQLKRAA